MASDVRPHAQLHHLKACTSFALLNRGVSTDIVNAALTVIDSWAQLSAPHDSPLQANHLSSTCTLPPPVDKMSTRMHAIHPSSMCMNQNSRDVVSAGQAQKNDECTAFKHASRSFGQPRKLIFLNELLPETIRSHDAVPVGPQNSKRGVSDFKAPHFEKMGPQDSKRGVSDFKAPHFLEPPHGDSGQGPILHATSVRSETQSQLNALTIAHDEFRATLSSLETRLAARAAAAANEQITKSISAALMNFVPMVTNALQPVMDEIGARGHDNCAELRTRVDSLSTDLKHLVNGIWDANGQPRPLPTAGAGILGLSCAGDADCPHLPQLGLVADSLPCGPSPRAAPRGAALLTPGAAPAPSVVEHAPSDSVLASSPLGAAELQTHAARQITLIRAHQKQLAHADDQVALIRAHLACSSSAVTVPRAFAHCVQTLSQISTSEETSPSFGPRLHSDTVDLSCPLSLPPDANLTDAPRSSNLETACTTTGDLPWSLFDADFASRRKAPCEPGVRSPSQILTSARTSASSHVESHLDTVGLVLRPLSPPPDAKSLSDTADLSCPLSPPPDAKSLSDTVDLLCPLSSLPDANCEAGPIQNLNPFKNALSSEALNYDRDEESDGGHFDDTCRAWLNDESDDSDDDNFYDLSARDALHANFPRTNNFSDNFCAPTSAFAARSLAAPA